MFARAKHEREELIREIDRTDNQDTGASDEAIEHASKRSVMHRWVIGIGFFVLCVVLLIVLIWFVF